MATFGTKINPLHFPTLVSDFTKANAQVAQECSRESIEWIQRWSASDAITLYFSDSDGFFPFEGQLVDQRSGQTWPVSPAAVSGSDYWFSFSLAPYVGRRLVMQVGRYLGNFVSDYESEPFEVLPDSSDLIQNCSTVFRYWGCNVEFGWNWNTTDLSTVPIYVPTLRVFDSIREVPPIIQKTVRETYQKSYFICQAEVDFLKVVRIEFSPPWWHEKLNLVTLQRQLEIDFSRYVQEVEVQPGEQYENLPLFKGELRIRKADQSVLYRSGCC